MKFVSLGLFALFSSLSLLVAIASLRVFVAPAEEVMPDIAHYLPTMPVQAWAHIISGPLALLLLPFQLSRTLRTRAPRLHRWTGYLMVAAMLAGGVAALAMIPGFTGSAFAVSGFTLLALLWILFPLIGVAKARQRDFAAHRRFMLRAAVLTFGAVTLRLMMAPLMAAGWTSVETYDVTAWGCWLPWLLILEGRFLARSRPVSA